jgi:nucleotide-binding universal stress UspA family protein
MFKKIMICFDGSKGARKALHMGAKLARDYKSHVQAVWVNDLGTNMSDKDQEAFGETLREEMMEIERQEGVSVPFKEIGGTPIHDLLFFARQGEFDLMVLGYSSSEDYADLFGQNVSKIVPHAHCNVLVVR